MLQSKDIKNIVQEQLGIENIYDDHSTIMAGYKSILYGENAKTEEVNIYNPYKDGANIEYKIEKRQKPIKVINSNLQACKEFASLMFNEDIDFKVDLPDSDNLYTKEVDYLNNFYNEKNLWSRLENCIIDVLGTGCVGVVANYDIKWGTQITFYDGSCVIPITIKDNEIKECIFVGQDIADDTITYLSVHRIEWIKKTELINEQLLNSEMPSGYIIDNLAIKDGKIIEEKSIRGMKSTERLFAIFKPFNRNSQKYSTAFGVPIWLDFKDIADEIDTTFHISTKDLKITQAVLLASLELFKDSEDNSIKPPAWWSEFANIIMVSDPSKYSADGKTDNILQLESLPSKIKEYTEHINELLKMYSNGVGLGSEGLTINKLSTPTATQVISDNAQKFNSLKKHFSQLKDEISVLNKAILFLANLNERASYNIVPITFNTQDNVIVDDETKRQIGIEEVRDGVRSIFDYVVNCRNLSGDELVKELERLGLDKEGNKKDTIIDSMELYNNVDNKDNNQGFNKQDNQKGNIDNKDN